VVSSFRHLAVVSSFERSVVVSSFKRLVGSFQLNGSKLNGYKRWPFSLTAQ
jgi:hypothetical protein